MAPKPKAPKPKHVTVEDLRLDQKVVGRVIPGLPGEEPEVVEFRRPITVEEISVCPGQWRTHLHINRVQCWDGRTLVEVGK